MCVAVPMQVLTFTRNQALVGLSGVRMTVDISLIDDLKVGDYLLIHAGIAISRWLPEDTREILDLLGMKEGEY